MHMVTCTWWLAHGDVHMVTCTWWRAHGDMHMVTCTWWHAHSAAAGRWYMENGRMLVLLIVLKLFLSSFFLKTFFTQWILIQKQLNWFDYKKQCSLDPCRSVSLTLKPLFVKIAGIISISLHQTALNCTVSWCCETGQPHNLYSGLRIYKGKVSWPVPSSIRTKTNVYHEHSATVLVCHNQYKF